jgi:putative transposase
MPRAHRYFLPGHVWHITHRCHGRQFLLADQYDRREWLSWLRRAKKRYPFTVLGYTVTSNHVHLLAQDTNDRNAIPRAMQLVQGRTAQQYNQRTGRINAFWGDRYHATAVEPGTHLLRCLAYVDLNMVRAGVASVPEAWRECGYHELHTPRVRRRIIDINQLAMLLGCSDNECLKQLHLSAIEDGLRRDATTRDERWTRSVAVGSQTYVNAFAAQLGKRLRGRRVADEGKDGSCVLREPRGLPYSAEPTTVFLPGDNTMPLTLDTNDT